MLLTGIRTLSSYFCEFYLSFCMKVFNFLLDLPSLSIDLSLSPVLSFSFFYPLYFILFISRSSLSFLFSFPFSFLLSLFLPFLSSVEHQSNFNLFLLTWTIHYTPPPNSCPLWQWPAASQVFLIQSLPFLLSTPVVNGCYFELHASHLFSLGSYLSGYNIGQALTNLYFNTLYLIIESTHFVFNFKTGKIK